MKYDLGSIARSRGVRRKAVTLRPIEPTAALASLLNAPMQEIIRHADEAVRLVLIPAYSPRPVLTQDDTAGTIAGALASVGGAIRRLVVGIGPSIRRWAMRVEEWHRPKFAASVKAGTGAEVTAFLTAWDAEDQVAAAIEWAASLIQGLTDDLRKKIEGIVWAGFSNQTPREEIAKQIAEAIGVSRARARFIARDQTVKLASSLDGLRQLEAGIITYRWRHSGKVHFRPEHKARNGKVFRWDKPPSDGHPGHAPNCGCRALPYVNLG